MNHAEAADPRLAPRNPDGYAHGIGRAVATAAVVVALVLWCIVESIHPAGEWIAHGDASLALGLAAVILIAACVTGLPGLAFTALTAGVLACAWFETTMASRALAAVSIATLCYAVWQHRSAMRERIPGWLLAGGAATIPVGLWLAIRMDAAVFAAAIGAFLSGYALYAFVRAGTAASGAKTAGALTRVLVRLPDQRVVVSVLLAVAGLGLMARVL